MVRLYPKSGVAEILIVGYGNDLRSDDGAGRVVASRVEAMDLPGVVVRSQSQLTPELALLVTRADLDEDDTVEPGHDLLHGLA